MADRRMISRKIVEDDRFMSLSSSAQALYTQLCVGADDDGFNNQVTTSMFRSHASVADLNQLAELDYVFQFDTGVIVIRQWNTHNNIRKDRYHPTLFTNEKAQLGLDEGKNYVWLSDGCQLVDNLATEVRLGKVSIGKDSLGKDNDNNNKYISLSIPTLEEIDQYFEEANINLDADRFFNYYQSRDWKIQGNPITDWKAVVNVWLMNEEKQNGRS